MHVVKMGIMRFMPTCCPVTAVSMEISHSPNRHPRAALPPPPPPDLVSSSTAQYCSKCYKTLYENQHLLYEFLPVEICVSFHNAGTCVEKGRTRVECFNNDLFQMMQMKSWFELKFVQLNCEKVDEHTSNF